MTFQRVTASEMDDGVCCCCCQLYHRNDDKPCEPIIAAASLESCHECSNPCPLRNQQLQVCDRCDLPNPCCCGCPCHHCLKGRLKRRCSPMSITATTSRQSVGVARNCHFPSTLTSTVALVAVFLLPISCEATYHGINQSTFFRPQETDDEKAEEWYMVLIYSLLFGVFISFFGAVVGYFSLLEDELFKRYQREGEVVYAQVVSYEFTRRGAEVNCCDVYALTAFLAANASNTVAAATAAKNNNNNNHTNITEPRATYEYVVVVEYERAGSGDPYMSRVRKRVKAQEGDFIEKERLADEYKTGSGRKSNAPTPPLTPPVTILPTIISHDESFSHQSPAMLKQHLLQAQEASAAQASAEAAQLQQQQHYWEPSHHQQQQQQHHALQIEQQEQSKKSWNSLSSASAAVKTVTPQQQQQQRQQSEMSISSLGHSQHAGPAIMMETSIEAGDGLDWMTNIPPLTEGASPAAADAAAAETDVNLVANVPSAMSTPRRRTYSLSNTIENMEDLSMVRDHRAPHFELLELYVLADYPKSGLPRRFVDRACSLRYRLSTLGLLLFDLALVAFCIKLAANAVLDLPDHHQRRLGWYALLSFLALLGLELPIIHWVLRPWLAAALREEYLEHADYAPWSPDEDSSLSSAESDAYLFLTR